MSMCVHLVILHLPLGSLLPPGLCQPMVTWQAEPDKVKATEACREWSVPEKVCFDNVVGWTTFLKNVLVNSKCIHPPPTPPPPSAPQAFHFLPPNFVLRFITYRVKGLVPSSVTEAIKDVDPTHFVSPPPLKWTCKIYVIKKAFDVIQFKNSGFH